MILYYSPGACSLVAHIALEEAGVQFAASRVAIAQGGHQTPDYLRINPHARVPALEVSGQIVTESIAILNFLALYFHADGSVPLEDPLVAARCNELLAWCASTVHIGFAQVWRAERFTADAAALPAIQQGGHEALAGFFAEIEGLVGEGWTVGDRFTAVDSYFLVFFRWGGRIGADMAAFPRWAGLARRIAERPAVQRALAREGFTPDDFLAFR